MNLNEPKMNPSYSVARDGLGGRQAAAPRCPRLREAALFATGSHRQEIDFHERSRNVDGNKGLIVSQGADGQRSKRTDDISRTEGRRGFAGTSWARFENS